MPSDPVKAAVERAATPMRSLTRQRWSPGFHATVITEILTAALAPYGGLEAIRMLDSLHGTTHAHDAP